MGDAGDVKATVLEVAIWCPTSDRASQAQAQAALQVTL
jgi:hypothetical protein